MSASINNIRPQNSLIEAQAALSSSGRWNIEMNQCLYIHVADDDERLAVESAKVAKRRIVNGEAGRLLRGQLK